MSAYRETVIRPHAPFTWADVMADRQRRGLEPRPSDDRTAILPAHTPKAPKRAMRKPKAPAGPPRVTIEGIGEIDARDSRNNRPHVSIVYSGPPPKTPAAAAKIRRAQMLACPCRLCACALHPMTGPELIALGYGNLRAEHDAAIDALPGARPDWSAGEYRGSAGEKIDARAYVERLEAESFSPLARFGFADASPAFIAEIKRRNHL